MEKIELFHQSIEKWNRNKRKGIVIYPTGVGKTLLSLEVIRLLQSEKQSLRTLIVVPTLALQKQWEQAVNGISNVEIMVINTACRKKKEVDFLILDEVHTFLSERRINVLNVVKYEYILCLTATLSRLDGRERLLLEKIPIVDELKIDTAISESFISSFEEYNVLIELSEAERKEYDMISKNFNRLFAFFEYNLDNLKKALKGQYSNNLVDTSFFGLATKCYRMMHLKNSYLYNHPKKIKVAKDILDILNDYKAITFSHSIDTCERLKGEVGGICIHSEMGKLERDRVLESFKKGEYRVLHSVNSLNVGVNIEGLEMAIILGLNSSVIQRLQRLGRVIRKGDKKKPLIFNLVLKGTKDMDWVSKSQRKYIKTLSESQLIELLKKKSNG